MERLAFCYGGYEHRSIRGNELTEIDWSHLLRPMTIACINVRLFIDVRIQLPNALVCRTTSSRWVGGADSQANNKDGVYPPEDPRSRVGFGGYALILVSPR
jgi:hypothetical protein